MNNIIMLTLVTLTLLYPNSSFASSGPPLPQDQWDENTVLLLARALVSEADWSRQDHAAIVWTLQRRWKKRVAYKPNWTFENQIKAYCAAFKSLGSKRNRWVFSLPRDGERKPRGWPPNVSWKAHKKKWSKVLQFSSNWLEGKDTADPCQGRALHWGAPTGIDLERAQRFGWKRVRCGQTFNLFWRPRLTRS